jgi:ATP-dependent RNA helicase DDX41
MTDAFTLYPSFSSFLLFPPPSTINHHPSSNLLSFQSLRRIGRTGRCGKTGIATTFINKNCEETILLDLKHLLLEAKQRVPAVLSSLTGEDVAVEEIGGVKGCAFCGGLGHRIANCPKRAHATQKQAAGTSSREVLTGGDY